MSLITVLFSHRMEIERKEIRIRARFCDCLTQKRLVEEKSLDNGSNESNHSKSSVNNFLFLTPLLVLRRQVGKDTGSPFDVSGDGLIVVVFVEVGGLNDSNCEEDLDIDSPSDRLDGSENICVCVSLTREVDSGLLDQHTYNSKHTDTSVLDFGPTSVSEIGLDVRKTHRIESHITRHGSIELFWSDQERDGLGEFLGVEGNGVGSCALLHNHHQFARQKTNAFEEPQKGAKLSTNALPKIGKYRLTYRWKHRRKTELNELNSTTVGNDRGAFIPIPIYREFDSVMAPELRTRLGIDFRESKNRSQTQILSLPARQGRRPKRLQPKGKG